MNKPLAKQVRGQQEPGSRVDNNHHSNYKFLAFPWTRHQADKHFISHTNFSEPYKYFSHGTNEKKIYVQDELTHPHAHVVKS